MYLTDDLLSDSGGLVVMHEIKYLDVSHGYVV
jgi:hypothetical protein